MRNTLTILKILFGIFSNRVNLGHPFLNKRMRRSDCIQLCKTNATATTKSKCLPSNSSVNVDCAKKISSFELFSVPLSAVSAKKRADFHTFDICRAICKLTYTLIKRQLITRFCCWHFSHVHVTHKNNSLRNRYL